MEMATDDGAPAGMARAKAQHARPSVMMSVYAVWFDETVIDPKMTINTT